MIRRRAALPAAIVIGLVGCAAGARAQDNYEAADPNAADLFRYARMAVGATVPKIKTLEMKGRSKVDLNGTLIDCMVDIKLLLPDYYLRIDSTRTDAKLAGFAGKTVLNAIRTADGLSTPPSNLTSAILQNEQVRLARLLLGAMTYVTPNVIMAFHSSGTMAASIDPRVSAATRTSVTGSVEPNVIEIQGQKGFRAHLMMSAEDRMPIRILYPNPPVLQETMTFQDRRLVSGFKLPHRITTTAGGRVIDELVFDEILVNPEIGKGDFTKR